MLSPKIIPIETTPDEIAAASLPNGVSSDSGKTDDQGSKAVFSELVARVSALEYQKGNDSAKGTTTFVPIPTDSERRSNDLYESATDQRSRMKRALEDQLQLYQRQEDLQKEVDQLKLEKDEYALKESLWEEEQMKREQRQRRRKGITDQNVPLPQDVEPQVGTKPELHFVEWPIYKDSSSKAEANTFAIVILEGDPIATTHSIRQAFLKKLGRGDVTENVENSKGLSVATGRKTVSPEGTVPERIRINSRHILEILEALSGGNHLKAYRGSHVMVRPFRFLGYYEKAIREKLLQLQMRFQQPNEVLQGGNPQVPKTDAEGLNGNSSDTQTVTKAHTVIDTVSSDKRPSSVRDDSSDSEAEESEPENPYTDSHEALRHLQCLVDFIEGTIDKRAAFLASERCTHVTQADIWYLFKPGDEVVDQSHRQAYKVFGVSNASHKDPSALDITDRPRDDSDATAFSVHCVFIDFDGSKLGPVTKTFEIAGFEGEKAITSLQVYPLRFTNSGRGSISRNKFIAQAKTFLDVAAIQHMHYNGLALDTRDEIDSQVVIDFKEAFVQSEDEVWRPRIEALTGESFLDLTAPSYSGCPCSACETSRGDSGLHMDLEKKRGVDYIANLIPQDQSELPPAHTYPRQLPDPKLSNNALSDDDLVVMSHRVFGFVLRSRSWVKLDTAYLSPVKSGRGEQQHNESANGANGAPHQHDFGKESEFSQTAFDQLVLPSGHKHIVKSLVMQHFRNKASNNVDGREADIFKGKGKGLILLLHGPPGVGKTSTAEGIAELFQKPLFQITCGDLGTTASDLEIALELHFALASKWGCILLLDEAEVFLAQRTPQDYVRNGLVAVFLRVLEYYSGILFLTTNRLGDFDEAFTSRIHISLHYPQLDLDQTLRIFELNERLMQQRFEKKGRQLTIEENAIRKFAIAYWEANEKMRWNGRQIRNACQTALALAEFDAQGGSIHHIDNPDAPVKLTTDHLEVVSKAYKGFMQYLRDIYGSDSDRRAKSLGIRAREDVVHVNSGETNDNKNHQHSSSLYPRTPPQQQQQQSFQYPPMPGMPTDAYGQHYTFSQSFPQQMNPMMTANGGQIPLPSQQQQPTYIPNQGLPPQANPIIPGSGGQMPLPNQQQPIYLPNQGLPPQVNPTAWSTPPQQGFQQQIMTGQGQQGGTPAPLQGFQPYGVSGQGQQGGTLQISKPSE